MNKSAPLNGKHGCPCFTLKHHHLGSCELSPESFNSPQKLLRGLSLPGTFKLPQVFLQVGTQRWRSAPENLVKMLLVLKVEIPQELQIGPFRQIQQHLEAEQVIVSHFGFYKLFPAFSKDGNCPCNFFSRGRVRADTRIFVKLQQQGGAGRSCHKMAPAEPFLSMCSAINKVEDHLPDLIHLRPS